MLRGKPFSKGHVPHNKRHGRDPDLLHKREKKYRQSAQGRAVRNAAQNKRRTLQTEKIRRQRLARYGLTPEDYDAMFIAQSGACAVCRKVATHRLRIDHSHSSGKIRGLLCQQCNTGIGMFFETPRLFEEAVRYLQFHAEGPCF